MTLDPPFALFGSWNALSSSVLVVSPSLVFPFTGVLVSRIHSRIWDFNFTKFWIMSYVLVFVMCCYSYFHLCPTLLYLSGKKLLKNRFFKLFYGILPWSCMFKMWSHSSRDHMWPVSCLLRYCMLNMCSLLNSDKLIVVHMAKALSTIPVEYLLKVRRDLIFFP